jgi:hypothetical protein
MLAFTWSGIDPAGLGPFADRSPELIRNVCWQFQIQGHEEQAGFLHQGNTGIQYSTGVLTVTWRTLSETTNRGACPFIVGKGWVPPSCPAWNFQDGSRRLCDFGEYVAAFRSGGPLPPSRTSPHFSQRMREMGHPAGD